MSVNIHKAVLEHMGNAVQVCNLDGRIIYVNPAFERLTGKTLQDVSGKTCDEILGDPGRICRQKCPVAKVFADTSYVWDQKGSLTTSSGEVKIVKFSVSPLHNKKKMVGTIVTMEEANQDRMTGEGDAGLKHIEGALRESEKKYRSIFENAVEGMFQAAPDGRFLSVNSALARMTGFESPEEMIRAINKIKDEHYVDPGDQARFMQILEEEGFVEGFETQVYRSDGVKMWASINARAARDDTGNILYYEGTVEDITRRKQRTEELRLQVQILDQIHDAVISTDLQGTIMNWNKGAERLYGFTKEEALHSDISLIYPSDLLENLKKDVIPRLKSTGSWDTEIQMRKKSGETFYAHLLLSHLRNQQNKVNGIIGCHIDITRSKELEENLRQSQKMEAIGKLAGGVAHDFNNILSVIIGSASLLNLRIDKDNPLVSYTNQILNAAEQAASLTKSLLAFSRRQIINPKPVDVNDIVRNTKKLLSRLISEDVQFETFCCDANLPVLADEVQIEQALINLVTNARDAMPNGGSLVVRTELFTMDRRFIRSQRFGKEGSYAALKVKDTGCGMDAKTKEKAFDPFFTTKEVGKGTGLGLSIVYGIVKQHNGFVIVQSEPGRGSVFTIYLPIVRSEARSLEVEEPGGPLTGDETILVAEDNGAVRTLIRDVLESHGYTVLEAVDGEDAVRMFREHKDDVQMLLLDVVMPKRNGREAYEEAIKLKPDVKVLFTSGYTANVIHEKGVLDSRYAFIMKPVLPTALLKKTREVLDN
jgi:two-component system, cell cycle sensor histidine kinase and response regulator CckA